jgi:hydroxymethylglutaryl-CoA lyase
MADIGELLAALKDDTTLRPAVLVPNRKGFEMAVKQGVRDIVFVISVSEAHNQNNVRRSVGESFEEFSRSWDEFGNDSIHLRMNLATCFDCPFAGRVAESEVIAAVERTLAITDRVEFGICDTTGRAAPNHVGDLLATLVERFAGERVSFAFHGHDTYGLGVANALAAYQSGVRLFDAAAGGLGGCPFAPGASGNTASEDLVFAFEHMGISTGIDLAKLLEAAELTAAVEPAQAGGRVRHLPRERLLRGLQQAA